MYSLIVFDLDGTLTVSKSDLSVEMAQTLSKLLQRKLVGVISGASYQQFQDQFVSVLEKVLDEKILLSKLMLLPTTGLSFYRYQGGEWTSQYSEIPDEDFKQRIRVSLKEVLEMHPELNIPHDFDNQLEDRGSEMTFSALGQHADVEHKKVFDPDRSKRAVLVRELLEKLPDANIAFGGMTSIDITKKGFDKAYGVQRLCDTISINKSEVLYIGDALEPGGNDFNVKEAGFDTISVTDPSDTQILITQILHD